LDLEVYKGLNINTSYVYKWNHKPTYNWYIGSRTGKKAHLDDGYICSSKIVKPMILNNPNEWEKTIIATGSQKEMRELETELLVLSDAKNDPRSYNQHNQDGKFICSGHSKETIEKIRKNHKWIGKKRPAQSLALKGKKRKPEDVEKWASAMRGVKKSDNHIKALKNAFSKGIYITPLGSFMSSRDAANAHNVSKTTVLHNCFGYVARGVKYQSKDGWNFNPKEKNEII
jgi:hypothetical protein